MKAIPRLSRSRAGWRMQILIPFEPAPICRSFAVGRHGSDLSGQKAATAMLSDQMIQQRQFIHSDRIKIDEAPVALIERKSSHAIQDRIARTVPAEKAQLREMPHLDYHGFTIVSFPR
ncbi:MAG: hypothetical protein P1U72_20715 [Paracoccaceae bacterium]|nr:hypothetical protein [Paracoccaceae bacterium]